jgi:hypothetical protein
MFCECFRFANFPFCPEPKLFVSAERSAIFFPNFSSAASDVSFVRSCKGASALSQFFRKGQYPLDRVSITNPPREAAVLISLTEKAKDGLLLVHSTLPLNKTVGGQISSFLSSRRTVRDAGRAYLGSDSGCSVFRKIFPALQEMLCAKALAL